MGELFNFRGRDQNRANNVPPEQMAASSAPQPGDPCSQAGNLNSGEAFDFEVVEPEPLADDAGSASPAIHVPKAEPKFERRRRRRAIISAPVRVRSKDVTFGPDEILTTTNVSR